MSDLKAEMGPEREILKSCQVVAIVGLSSKTDRPSNRVGRFLKEKGYKVIPVNPAEKTILEEACYPDLSSIPVKVDVVNIFRRSEDVLPIIDECLKIGAKAVWMQEGVINEEAARKARDAGLKVVMDKCMLKEYNRLISP
jgi:uncharacterized protein